MEAKRLKDYNGGNKGLKDYNEAKKKGLKDYNGGKKRVKGL